MMAYLNRLSKCCQVNDLQYFRVGSALLTLSVTVERFMAISRPFYKEKKGMKMALIATPTLFSILYNLPRYLSTQLENQRSWG